MSSVAAVIVAAAGLTTSALCQSSTNAPPSAPAPAATGLEKPGLTVGTAAPDAALQTVDQKDVQLLSYIGKKPVVITFYRGGWCTQCTHALAEWSRKVDELKALGAEVIFITPEKPEFAALTARRSYVNAVFLSDIKMEAARNFNLLTTLDEKTKISYKGYGIDLGAKNAGGTWDLPLPSTYVIDTGGVIRWAFNDPDYKKRARIEEVIEAVKGLKSVEKAAAK